MMNATALKELQGLGFIGFTENCRPENEVWFEHAVRSFCQMLIHLFWV